MKCEVFKGNNANGQLFQKIYIEWVHVKLVNAESESIRWKMLAELNQTRIDSL